VKISRDHGYAAEKVAFNYIKENSNIKPERFHKLDYDIIWNNVIIEVKSCEARVRNGRKKNYSAPGKFSIPKRQHEAVRKISEEKGMKFVYIFVINVKGFAVITWLPYEVIDALFLQRSFINFLNLSSQKVLYEGRDIDELLQTKKIKKVVRWDCL